MWERNRDQRWEMPSFFLFFFFEVHDVVRKYLSQGLK